MLRFRPGSWLLVMVTLHAGLSSQVHLGKNVQGSKAQYPPLDLVTATMKTTASRDFADHHEAFVAAHHWQRAKLLDSDKPAPYLACAEYGNGKTARDRLESKFSNSGTSIIFHSRDHGACFVVTAATAEAEDLIQDASAFGLTSAGPFPSVLKLSPGLLDSSHLDSSAPLASSPPTGRRQGQIDKSAWEGLSVRLSPGVMKSRDASSKTLVKEWQAGFKSGSVDTARSSNFWADPEMLGSENGHLSRPEGEALAQRWTKAADVLDDMLGNDKGPLGEACGWHKVGIHPTDEDLLLMIDMDHLLPKNDDQDTRVACYMYFLSHLASKPEVLRISPLAKEFLSNDVSSAVIQSANIVNTPLFGEGLNGTGEVIQVIDSGLDETSCFFVDDDGLEIQHGSYFDGVTNISGSWELDYSPPESYHFDPSRRKVVQYIELFKTADPDVDQVDGDGYYYFSERYGPGLGDWHDNDEEGGHGTHTAGTAAGARIPGYLHPTCAYGYQDGCVGECITPAEAEEATNNSYLDINTYCPSYACDGSDAFSPNCLTDDPVQNLDDNSGIAPGAKLAIFDVSHGGSIMASFAGNGLWDVSLSTGAKIHSNSYSSSTNLCEVADRDIKFDRYIYENPEHLIIFSAGNNGGLEDFDDDLNCTVGSPGVGKNTLTVGATSSGPTRVPVTGTDGRARYEQLDRDPDDPYAPYGLPSTSSEGADIDTVAYFSSYGPTADGRIKPEVVAPGDRVFSAFSDGTDYGSCKILANSGTSMSAPAVAGAAALVRQYFMDSTFYVNDLESRGLCFSGTPFMCQPFSPSAATVKAMLINSANLMGGSTQPDGYRGFGRVHLESGMPFRGEGKKILYVADSSITFIFSHTSHGYTFDVDATAGEDIRVTLSWIDEPNDSLSGYLLSNDLDLKVTGPDGTIYYMWDGVPDTANVNERVIVPAAEVVSGSWRAEVSADELLTIYQAYSLVVTFVYP